MLDALSYKKQETVLILMNIAVLAALFFVHISFVALLGRPTASLLVVLGVRFLILVLELFWVQKLTEESSLTQIWVHIHLSILLNIVFAFLAAVSGGTADSHYSVLMIFPIIAAAYRFDLSRTLLVTVITICLTFLEVWIYFRAHPPADVTEYFEAATVSLVFLVVAIVVWLLVGNLRGEEEKLSASLDELRLLQEKLVAEEKLAAVGQLSSAIAHEIRNPVTMISSSLRMAETQKPGSPLRSEMFEIATQEAKRLETLTTDFLAFARTKEPELKPASAIESLEYVAGVAKAYAAEKNLSLIINCKEDLEIVADTALIHQALLNLVTNAIKASSPGGSIELGAEDIGGKTILYVQNDGDPISDEIAGRIFEPFFTSGERGTGLGLSIVRKIARAHGGEVALAENSPGRVRFEIKLQDRRELI